METNLVRADKRCQQKILAICSVVGLLGAALLMRVFPWWEEYTKGLNLRTAMLVSHAIMLVVFLALVPVGIYTLRFGRRVMVCEQHPPPGVKVVLDTKLLQGQKARTRGRMLVVLSSLMIGLGTSGALLMVAFSLVLML